VAFAWTLFIVWVFLAITVLALSKSGADLAAAEATLAKVPSDQYLLLLGGPFAALIAAKGIVTSRLASGALQKSQGDGRLDPKDLISDDAGRTDLVDLQYALFSLVALVWAVAMFVKQPLAGLPTIPGGLAGLTSASALTYIGNKAIQRNTPLIASLTPSTAHINEAVTIRGSNLIPPYVAKTDDAKAPTPHIAVGGFKADLDQTADPPTDRVITFLVPDNLKPGEVDVTVSAGDGTTGGGTDTAKLTIEERQPVEPGTVHGSEMKTGGHDDALSLGREKLPPGQPTARGTRTVL
jgi:hypothetical protein